MDLINYLGKRIHIVLTNNFYYEGNVIDADEVSITLRDKKGQLVSLTKQSILTIQEINKNE